MQDAYYNFLVRNKKAPPKSTSLFADNLVKMNDGNECITYQTVSPATAVGSYHMINPDTGVALPCLCIPTDVGFNRTGRFTLLHLMIDPKTTIMGIKPADNWEPLRGGFNYLSISYGDMVFTRAGIILSDPKIYEDALNLLKAQQPDIETKNIFPSLTDGSIKFIFPVVVARKE